MHEQHGHRKIRVDRVAEEGKAMFQEEWHDSEMFHWIIRFETVAVQSKKPCVNAIERKFYLSYYECMAIIYDFIMLLKFIIPRCTQEKSI